MERVLDDISGDAEATELGRFVQEYCRLNEANREMVRQALNFEIYPHRIEVHCGKTEGQSKTHKEVG